MAVLLCGAASAYTTGATIRVDGGMTARSDRRRSHLERLRWKSMNSCQQR
jgi:hypothetical protein